VSIAAARLVLGGHSFCTALANDPAPTAADARRLVAACGDVGIDWFDTTYRPERTALGNALRGGTHPRARVIAWNFFKDFRETEEPGGPEAYQPAHIAAMLDDLGVARLDLLIVHHVGDRDTDLAQERLAFSWLEQGKADSVGLWHPDAGQLRRKSYASGYSAMVRPCNITTRDNSAFECAKELGWQTFACSPFVRGWELDKLIKRAQERDLSADPIESRTRIADHLLRWSLYSPGIDHLIVAMRKPEWVAINAASAARGPLSLDERAWLMALRDSAG
jgi:aryl-alcohol dehydrogenase-like predicted oxidoreductase